MKVKKFHLIDSEGKKLVITSGDSVDKLIDRIASVTGSVTNKDVPVVSLTPLPRYQSICCVEPKHGLQNNENPGTLKTLLRDVGIYMGRYGLLNH